MNAQKVDMPAATELIVSTQMEDINANARLGIAVIHTMVNVPHRKDVVLLIRSAEVMKNAFNLANVCARHHFTWTPETATNARALANDTHVE